MDAPKYSIEQALYWVDTVGNEKFLRCGMIYQIKRAESNTLSYFIKDGVSTYEKAESDLMESASEAEKIFIA